MSAQMFQVVSNFFSAIIGGFLTFIPTWVMAKNEHKRWLIDKKIDYLREELSKISKEKVRAINMLQTFFDGGTFYGDSGGISSLIPMEVIEAVKKHLPDGKTNISTLSKSKKNLILLDVAAAFENKSIELNKNIKELLS